MRMKTKIYLYLIPITLFLFLWGCKKDLTPADNTSPEIKLTVEDVGVTEVWLRLNVQSRNPKNQIIITRNDSTILQFNNLTIDTLIYDSGLLPNHDYNYTAALSDAEPAEASASAEITTMDTTSHYFTWETFTFGDGGTCQFLDVSIISENDIWATGQVWLKDSTGQFIHPPYNAIHWDGLEWVLLRIPYHDFGTTIEYPGLLKTVFAFNSNNVYVNSSANLLKWDGNSWTEKAFFMTAIPFNGQVRKIWGSNEDDIYCVGNTGAIYHTNTQTWQLVESGTDLPIQDIWGIRDSNNETQRILCVASEKYQTSDSKILQINPDKSVEEIYWVVPRRLHSVWFNSPNIFFIAGHGVFRKSIGLQLVYNELPDKFVNRIRGKGLNDVFICGDYGLLAHYNGLTWQEFSDPQLSSTLYESLDFKGNIVVAVGSIGGREAAIAVGKRN